MRIMLPSAVIFGISGLVMGVLNAHQKFLIPALAPGMYPLGMIAGILLFSKPLGIFSLAWGVLIGASLHLALQIPALIRLRGTYSPSLGLNLPAVREVVRLMGPRLIGVAAVQINFWVNIQLASFLPEGSITAVNYGFALMLMPQAAIAQAIATASLPTFSAQAALGRLDEMRQSLAATLRGVLLLSLPASVGLILLARPIVTFLLEGGMFDAASTDLVAWVLMWYAVGLVGHSMVEVASRAFYALHNTRTPVVVGVIAMSLNVLLSFLFVFVFARLGWAPHGGLAFANSLATGLEMAALLYLLRRLLNGLEGRRLLASLMYACLAGAAMAAVLLLWNYLSGAASAWIAAFGGVAAGGLVYGLGLRLLRVPEVSALTSAVRRRFSR
jgi:putative peptidoglycan lipid II flippase